MRTPVETFRRRDGAYVLTIIVFFVVLFVAGAILLIVVTRVTSILFGWPALGKSARKGRFEVRRVTLGVDWTARRELQAGLGAMAGRAPLGKAAELTVAARAARDLLRGAIAAARYAAFQSFSGSPAEVQAQFQRLAGELRTRYRVETARGALQLATPAVQARADEGEGLVVVSLVVGVKEPLPRLPATLDRGGVERALATLVPAGASSIAALEVIWSPSLEQDRLSSYELEQHYPELVRLDRDPNLGTKVCAYCAGVFPAELGTCPGCGARPAS